MKKILLIPRGTRFHNGVLHEAPRANLWAFKIESIGTKPIRMG